MSNCTSGCANQDHASYAECLKLKGLRVAYANSANNQDYTQQKRWDSDIDYYKSARAQGVQPSTTKRVDVDRAMELSSLTGSAYEAG